MTDFQLIVLAIILYSVATTFYIIFLTWQLHKSNKKINKQHMLDEMQELLKFNSQESNPLI